MKPGSGHEEEGKPGMMAPGSHHKSGKKFEQQGGIIVTTTLALEYPGTELGDLWESLSFEEKVEAQRALEDFILMAADGESSVSESDEAVGSSETDEGVGSESEEGVGAEPMKKAGKKGKKGEKEKK